MCPLALCHVGEHVVVEEVAGGDKMRSRLKAMGVMPGEQVEVLATQGGPVVVNVKGSRLGIGVGMAQKIFVRPV